MSQHPTLIQAITGLPQTNLLEIVRQLLEGLIAVFAFYRATAEVRERWEDLRDKHRGKKYRVKSTHIKHIMRDTRTEISKLRRVRVFQPMEVLSLDPVPRTYSGSGRMGVKRRVHVTNHYSIPGRSDIDPESRFEIRFMEDEEMRAHHDHPLLLSFAVEEPLSELMADPFFTVKQPVGTECLTYEAHVQSGSYRLYPKDHSDGPPQVTVAVAVGGQEDEVPPDQVQVRGGTYDFDDGHGESEWFRVTVRKPPQKGDIKISWHWQPVPDGHRTSDPGTDLVVLAPGNGGLSREGAVRLQRHDGASPSPVLLVFDIPEILRRLRHGR